MTKATYTLKHTDEEIGLEYYDIILKGTKIGDFEFAPKQNCVTWIGIDEEYQGKGIGTQILRTISNDFGTIYLAPMDEDNEKLYKRIGSQVDEGSKVYNDWGFGHDQGFGLYEI